MLSTNQARKYSNTESWKRAHLVREGVGVECLRGLEVAALVTRQPERRGAVAADRMRLAKLLVQHCAQTPA